MFNNLRQDESEEERTAPDDNYTASDLSTDSEDKGYSPENEGSISSESIDILFSAEIREKALLE
ncbi:1457_t:CDS:1, partial [Dentiscutata erythropus]